MRVAGIPLGVGQMLSNPSDTLALLHFDGAAASTTFVDSSIYANTYIAVGSAIVSTAQSKFGGSSLAPNGWHSNYIQSTTGNPFSGIGGSDFTAEGWFYQVDLFPEGHGMFELLNSGDGTVLSIYVTSGVLTGAINTVTGGTQYFSHQGVATANSWNHAAIERFGNTVTLYLNGVPSASIVDVTGKALTNSISRLIIGASSSQDTNIRYGIAGYVDEFRLKIGAVYKGAFTPPTSPFTV